MKQPVPDIRSFATITDYTRFYGRPDPLHPLLAVLDLAPVRELPFDPTPMVPQFYSIALKKNLRGTLHYGRQTYDFQGGLLTFVAPGQVFAASPSLDISELTGWMLLIHPDLVAKYPLAKKLAGYGFFSYQVHEALHLSAREEQLLEALLSGLRAESEQPLDAFSHDVLVAQLDALLTYANRFYHRQFLTRRVAEHDLLSRFENLLTAYFAQPDEGQSLPTVHYFADALGVSAAYLSDMLRALTGQNTQQHIHAALLEKAKQLLLSTALSVNEVAFQLGFEYPHYFTRLFKSKTGLTPKAYRFSAH